MKNSIWLTTIRPSAVFLALSTLLFGIIYPLFIMLINQLAFFDKSLGSIISIKGEVKGSALIGQSFLSPHYFLSRPSATQDFPYNAKASNGSNLSAANPLLKKLLAERIQYLQTIDPTNAAVIPIDLITASASGLDPHISIASAEYQIARIARLRQIDPPKLRYLVYSLTELRQFGILGEPRVNVLKLNIALDEMTAKIHGN